MCKVVPFPLRLSCKLKSLSLKRKKWNFCSCDECSLCWCDQCDGAGRKNNKLRDNTDWWKFQEAFRFHAALILSFDWRKQLRDEVDGFKRRGCSASTSFDWNDWSMNIEMAKVMNLLEKASTQTWSKLKSLSQNTKNCLWCASGLKILSQTVSQKYHPSRSNISWSMTAVILFCFRLLFFNFAFRKACPNCLQRSPTKKQQNRWKM